MSQSEFVIKNGILLYYYGKTKTEVVIPDSVTKIGDNTFQSIQHITSIVIPSSVKRIGFGAFYNCSKLEQIVLPDTIRSIEDNTFEYCINLKNITIPENVTKIGKRAFYQCRSLTSIIIPENVTKIDASAFDGCKNLEYITYHGISFRNEPTNYLFTQTIPLHKIFHAIECNEDILTQSLWPAKLKFSVLWGMFFANPEDDKIFKQIKSKFTEMFRFLINENDSETARKVLETRKLIKKGNIDKLILYAIDKRAIEIQVMLTDYKAKHIGFESDEEIISKKFAL